MKIYLSSSWRNCDRIRALAAQLRTLGHTVFDFTSRSNSVPRDSLPPFTDQPYVAYIDQIAPLINDQIITDIEEIEDCDLFVLLLPCGSDSHFEMGYAHKLERLILVVGQPKPDQFVGMHLCAREILADDSQVLDFAAEYA